MIFLFFFWVFYFIFRTDEVTLNGAVNLFKERILSDYKIKTGEIFLNDSKIAEILDFWIKDTKNLFLMIYACCLLFSGYLVSRKRKLFSNIALIGAGINNLILSYVFYAEIINPNLFRFLYCCNAFFFSPALLACFAALREQFPNNFESWSRFISAANQILVASLGWSLTKIRLKGFLSDHNYFLLFGLFFLLLSIFFFLFHPNEDITAREKISIKDVFVKFFFNYKFLLLLLSILFGSTFFSLCEIITSKRLSLKYINLIGMSLSGILAVFLLKKINYKKLGNYYGIIFVLNTFFLFLMGSKDILNNSVSVFVFFLFGLLQSYGDFYVLRINRSGFFNKAELSTLLGFLNFLRVFFGLAFRYIFISFFKFTNYQTLFILSFCILFSTLINFLSDKLENNI